VITRDLQIALARYTAGIDRSRREYAAQPTACADWCIRCVNPVGTNRACPTCRDTLRARTYRAEKKEAAR
jgi:hypothetical protein